MTLLSVSHHVNLANACPRLNDKNRISTAFFRRHFSRRLASVNGCREPSGKPMIRFFVRLGSPDLRASYASRRYGASKPIAAVVSRLCHGTRRYGVGSTVVRVWASENFSV
jgi:hypothetical protein